MGPILFNFPFERNTPFSGFSKISKGAMVEALALSQSEHLQSGSLQHNAHSQYEVHLSHVARFGAESATIFHPRRVSVGKGTSQSQLSHLRSSFMFLGPGLRD